MTAMRKFWADVASLWSLIVGLKITGKYSFCRQKTVHYPRKTVTNLQSYGGHIELVGSDGDPAKPKCITCMMCTTVCPSQCYTVVKAKPPKPTPEELQAQKEAEAKGEKIKPKAAPKTPISFLYDYSLCSLCGLCIDSCPADSLRYSNNVYLTSFDRNLQIDLLARLKKQAGAGATNTSVQKEA